MLIIDDKRVRGSGPPHFWLTQFVNRPLALTGYKDNWDSIPKTSDTITFLFFPINVGICTYSICLFLLKPGSVCVSPD